MDALASARRSKRVGVGGWAVAAVLCGLMAFVLANREFAPLSPGKSIQIALAEPAASSPQPAVAAAALGSDLFSTILPPAHAGEPRLDLGENVAPQVPKVSQPEAAQPARSARSRATPERRSRSAAARDAEFLEREDYIY